MDAGIAFVVFKALLGFGLPIALCTQQLIVTKRAIRRDREAAARAAATAASTPAPPAVESTRELEVA
jgi:hypothetical protein